MGPSDIADAVASLARSISDSLNAEPACIVGIRSRGDEVAERVITELSSLGHTNIDLGVLDISLYRDDFSHRSGNPTLQSTDIPFEVDEARIIIVDDVLFTGRTIRAALDAIHDYGRPAQVELAVLIDRGHRELPIQANYIGTSLSTERSDHVDVKLLKTDGEDSVTLINH